jgi:hypothetical protein
MVGGTSATNARMLDLAKRLGFSAPKSPDGPTVCLVRRDLGPVGRRGVPDPARAP